MITVKFMKKSHVVGANLKSLFVYLTEDIGIVACESEWQSNNVTSTQYSFFTEYSQVISTKWQFCVESGLPTTG